MTTTLNTNQLIADILAQNQQMLNFLTSSANSAPAPAPAPERAPAPAPERAPERAPAPARAPARAPAPAPARAPERSPSDERAPSDERPAQARASTGKQNVPAGARDSASAPERSPSDERAPSDERPAQARASTEKQNVPSRARAPASASACAPPCADEDSAPAPSSADDLLSELDSSFSRPSSKNKHPTALHALKSKPTHLSRILSLIESKPACATDSQQKCTTPKEKKRTVETPLTNSSITKFEPVYPRPPRMTKPEFDSVNQNLAKLSKSAGDFQNTVNELTQQYKLAIESVKRNGTQSKQCEIDQEIETLKERIESENKMFIAEKNQFFQERKKITAEPDSLTEADNEEILRITSSEHSSRVFGSIQSIFNHLRHSQNGIEISKTASAPKAPCVVIYPNGKGPEKLKDSEFLQEHQVSQFLFLRLTCIESGKLSDILRVDFSTDSKKHFIKIDNRFCEFGLVPSTQNIIRWIIHIESVAQSILDAYNVQKKTKHTMEEVLSSNKDFFVKVFHPSEHSTKKEHSQKSRIPDMFADLSFSGGCAVSSPMKARCGGGVASSSRTSSSADTAKSDMETLLGQWQSSMKGTVNCRLSQIAIPTSRTETQMSAYKAIEDHSDFKDFRYTGSGKKTVAKFLVERRIIRTDGEGNSTTFTVLDSMN